MTHKDIDLLFETSWEVCNKVGGIYTVLSTKAKNLQSLYKDRVVFIGPDVWTDEHPSPWFTESKALLKAWREQALLPEGVSVRVGRWEVPGRPIVVLVGFEGMYARNNELYGRMWQLYGVDSLHAYGDYGEACAFSHAAALVQESIARWHGKNAGNIVAHFDEWTTGMALLHVKAEMPEIATVFTTHATSIGRSICGNGKPLYDYLHAYNGDQMAGELNMEAKHSLEKAAATQADCFTTVSEITARECEQLLGRRPDVVTPNGFEAGFVPGPRKIKTVREAARKNMLGVAEALTGNKYDDNTFIIASSGRCEYRNKGLDMMLDVLATLRTRTLDRKVVAFIMVPAWVKDPRTDLRMAIDNHSDNRLADPVITHTLNNPHEDAVLGRIHGLGFDNSADSKVTVIYVPCYLNGADGIFDMTYYDLLAGMDATVFPSYYEPWGYTPLESVAFGVPTVTTSLSGFGCWVRSDVGRSPDATGVEVIDRNDSNYGEATQGITNTLDSLINDTAAHKDAIDKAARHTAALASWQIFIKDYEKAYDIAIENKDKRNQN